MQQRSSMSIPAKAAFNEIEASINATVRSLKHLKASKDIFSRYSEAASTLHGVITTSEKFYDELAFRTAVEQKTLELLLTAVPVGQLDRLSELKALAEKPDLTQAEILANTDFFIDHQTKQLEQDHQADPQKTVGMFRLSFEIAGHIFLRAFFDANSQLRKFLVKFEALRQTYLDKAQTTQNRSKTNFCLMLSNLYIFLEQILITEVEKMLDTALLPGHKTYFLSTLRPAILQSICDALQLTNNDLEDHRRLCIRALNAAYQCRDLGHTMTSEEQAAFENLGAFSGKNFEDCTVREIRDLIPLTKNLSLASEHISMLLQAASKPSLAKLAQAVDATQAQHPVNQRAVADDAKKPAAAVVGLTK